MSFGEERVKMDDYIIGVYFGEFLRVGVGVGVGEEEVERKM